MVLVFFGGVLDLGLISFVSDLVAWFFDSAMSPPQNYSLWASLLGFCTVFFRLNKLPEIDGRPSEPIKFSWPFF